MRGVGDQFGVQLADPIVQFLQLGERGPGGVQQLPARPHSVMAGCVVDPHRVALLPAQSECGRRTRRLRVSV